MAHSNNSAHQAKGALVKSTKSVTGGWLGRFWQEQSGAMSYIAVAGSLVMMVFGGIGIDMIYTEVKRAKIQNTLDRSVLAAAAMRNSAEPQVTVQSYFDAMGLGDALGDVSVEETLNSRAVTAQASTTMPSNFMRLVGIDTLQAGGEARAVEALTKIEVSLVLDVSGSMGGTKLTQLKDAAKAFIDEVLPPDNNGQVTISIVPYNATVNLGTDLSSHFAMEELHSFSHCAYFEPADFDTTGVDPEAELGQIGHFDPYGGGDGTGQTITSWCSPGSTQQVVAFSSDPDELKAHVDTFVARGNTAIDLGMKWGTALLDPSLRPVASALISDGLIGEAALQRPATYDDPDSLKYVIVMTDGQNTTQFDLKPARKEGTSEVFIDTNGNEDATDDRLSVMVVDNPGDDTDVFLWPHLLGTAEDPYHNGPYSDILDGAAPLIDGIVDVSVFPSDETEGDDSDVGGWREALIAWLCNRYGNGDANCENGANSENNSGQGQGQGQGNNDEDVFVGQPIRLENTDLLAHVKTVTIGDWYYQAYLAGQVAYSDYVDAYYSYESTVTYDVADSQLSTVCGAARDQGIVVFAIGVEAPTRGLDAMQDCASSPTHYYDVDGSELNATFSSIARTMMSLRLTQ